MRKTKRFMALGLAAAMTLSMVACGGGKADSTTAAPTKGSETTAAANGETTAAASGNTGINTTDKITLTMSWWGGDSRHAATQAAIEAFEKKYPNIHIEPTFGGWQGWEEKMGLSFSNKTSEDIVQMGTTWHTTYNKTGDVFYDLYQAKDVLDLTQFDGLENFEVNGKLAAIPVSMTARTMFWNKATFDKAGIDIPKTWDDLLAAGETFKTKLGDDYYPMMLTNLDRMIFMVYYLESKYGKVWVKDGVPQYSVDEVAEGFAMLRELEDKHVMPTMQMILDNGADPVEKSTVWIEGKWAGVYTWNTSPAALVKALPNGSDLVAGKMFEGFPNKGGFSKASMTFAIAATCEHPIEAAAFLNFALNEEEGVLAMAGERGVPYSKAGSKILSDAGSIDPLIKEATEYALGWASFPMDPQFESSAYKATTEGLYDQTMNAFSYNEVDAKGAAEMLLKGMEEHEASVK